MAATFAGFASLVLKIIANYVKRQPATAAAAAAAQQAGVGCRLCLSARPPGPTHRLAPLVRPPLKSLTYNLRGRQSKVKVASL